MANLLLAECKLVVVRYPPLRSQCKDRGLMKYASMILGLKRLKEVRCRHARGELVRGARSSYVSFEGRAWASSPTSELGLARHV